MARISLAVAAVAGLFLALCPALEAKRSFEVRLEDLLRGPSIDFRSMTRFRRMVDGTVEDACNFPGVVAVTFGTKMLCNGVHEDGVIIVPTDCGEFIAKINFIGDIDVYGDDGSVTGQIAESEAEVTDNGDGTSSVALTSVLTTSSCTSVDYVPYEASMDIDTSTCTITSYGGATTKGHTYDQTLQSSLLADNPLLGCCSHVIPNLAGQAQFGEVDTTNTGYYTCAKSSNSLCNGDTGAPIYCTNNDTGDQVVVGMVATAKCDSSAETFVAIDFTGGALSGFSA